MNYQRYNLTRDFIFACDRLRTALREIPTSVSHEEGTIHPTYPADAGIALDNFKISILADTQGKIIQQIFGAPIFEDAVPRDVKGLEDWCPAENEILDQRLHKTIRVILEKVPELKDELLKAEHEVLIAGRNLLWMGKQESKALEPSNNTFLIASAIAMVTAVLSFWLGRVTAPTQSPQAAAEIERRILNIKPDQSDGIPIGR